jgi:hypothetical protein
MTAIVAADGLGRIRPMKPSRNRPIPSEAIARFFDPPPRTPAPGVPPETLAEYVDRRRFPLTSRPGLSPRQQLLTDAYNLRRVREHLKKGGTLTDRKWARLAELVAEEKARPVLLAQLSDLAR